MRAVATLIGSLATALAAFGLAMAAPGGAKPRPEIEAAAAGGAVQIINSHEGQAVLTAAGIDPGGSAVGSVQIANAGAAPGRLAVRVTDVHDRPGPYGGPLSERVELQLVDVTDPSEPVTLYAGPPAGLSDLALGALPAGSSRDYAVSATLPAGVDDDLYQGSTLSFGLQWQATPGAEPRSPQPDPSASRLAAVDVPPAAVGLPPAGPCLSRRHFTIHPRAPRGARPVSARIAIAGRRAFTVRRAAATIDLRGMPKGTVRVRITVRGSDGRSYRSVRVYHPCALAPF
jgi:hypothetical protein